jgi:hypothetical protein
MTTERDDSLHSVSVRLDGKNYSYWSYVMQNVLKVKRCGDMSVETIWYLRIPRKGMLL